MKMDAKNTVTNAEPIDRTCQFRKPDRTYCRRRVADGERMCWQHARGLRIRLRSLARSEPVAFGIGILGLTMTLLFGLLTLFPRLSISNTGPIDPDDAFSTPFHVVNDGYVPLFSVRFSVAIGQINVSDWIPNYKSRITRPEWYASSFWPNDAFDVYAGDILRAKGAVRSADIAIVVEYHPFGIPTNRDRLFRFVTEIGADNRPHWMQRPDPN
jgi:hypothetical protein